jgi:hypothetical protein
VLKHFLLEQIAIDLSNFINQEAKLETFYGLYSALGEDSNNSPVVTESEWLRAEDQYQFSESKYQLPRIL